MRNRQPGDVCWYDDPFVFGGERVLVVLKKLKKRGAFTGWRVENLRTKEKMFAFGTHLSASLNAMEVLARMSQ